jgi:hypothetical protein
MKYVNFEKKIICVNVLYFAQASFEDWVGGWEAEQHHAYTMVVHWKFRSNRICNIFTFGALGETLKYYQCVNFFARTFNITDKTQTKKKKSKILTIFLYCYIKIFQRKGFYDVTQTFTCTSKAIVPAQDMFRFGKRIAEFCQGDEVMFSERKFITKRKRSIRAIREASSK